MSESQLHNIIKESVKEVLSELDARTYASARDKASARGQFRRASDFHDAAVDSFNKQQGFDIEDRWNNEYSRDTLSMKPDGSVDSRLQHDTGFTYLDDRRHYNPHTGTIDNMLYVDRYQDDNPSYGQNERTFKAKYSKMPSQYQVAKQMADGSGQYVKGKGWK